VAKRRNFTPDFKARVALGAFRGDKTIQEISSKHKLHPSQVSTWKRHAVGGLGEVFSGVSDRTRIDTNHLAWCLRNGAPRRNRTGTPLREWDFESHASTNSARGAR
jgi:transposase-like protein